MIITIIFLALLGACIGSYMAARAFRVINEHEIDAWGRSACMSCRRTLEAVDLVPILSFIFYKGKCRTCGENISLLYIFVESVTALLFVIAGTSLLTDVLLTFEITAIIKLVLVLIFVSILVYISIVDIYIQAFPIGGLLIATGFYIVSSAVLGMPLSFMESLSGIIFFLSVFILFRVGGKLLFKKEAFGEGDIYLGMFLGSFLGLGHSIVALYAAIFSGALYSLYIVLLKDKPKATIPFAPFLCFGALVAYFFAPGILDWYQNAFFLA
ncbi:MAG: prepilin peptidase [Candidatus Gracilibacteria bacterium]